MPHQYHHYTAWNGQEYIKCQQTNGTKWDPFAKGKKIGLRLIKQPNIQPYGQTKHQQYTENNYSEYFEQSFHPMRLTGKPNIIQSAACRCGIELTALSGRGLNTAVHPTNLGFSRSNFAQV